MGYWWPPSLFAFDPVDRPFAWRTEQTVATPMNPIPFVKLIPSEYDQRLIECLDREASKRPFVKARGGFQAYAQMVTLIAPDDPPSIKEKGGLPGDTMNEDGSLTVNYFDFSDSSRVYRKRVTYVMDPKTNQPIIKPALGGIPELLLNGRWQKEGPDVEREFGKTGIDVLNAIVSVASGVLSLTGVSAAAVAAFQIMWQFTLKQLKAGGKPPSVDDIINLAGALGKAVGPGIWGVVSKSPDVQKLFTNATIAQISKVPGQYADKVAALANDLGQILPRLPMRSLYPGFDPTKWAAGALKGVAPPPTSAITLGTSGKEAIPLDSFDQFDPRRTAWGPAATAFGEIDPVARGQVRRNYLWCVIDNSSAISQGNPQGAGAHGEVENDDGLMNAGSFFDQYLGTLLSSSFYMLDSAALGVINVIEGARRADPKAKDALYAVVSDLRDRYRMST
jgi:hypothetical protein